MNVFACLDIVYRVDDCRVDESRLVLAHDHGCNGHFHTLADEAEHVVTCDS